MDIISKTEKNYGRIETRTAYVTSQIEWLEQRSKWKNLCCIGAIHTEFDSKKVNRANGIIRPLAKLAKRPKLQIPAIKEKRRAKRFLRLR